MAIPVPPLIGLSLGGVDADGRWAFRRGEASIRDALLNILLTIPGQRLMRPEFGAGIERFVHQPNNETTRSLLQSVVERAVRATEPRIDLDAVEVVPHATEPTFVTVALRYRIRGLDRPDAVRLDLNLDT